MTIRSLPIALLFAVSLTSAIAQDLPALIANQLPDLLSIYKDLHAHPELSQHEVRTAALLASELAKAGFKVTSHAGKYPNGQQAEGVVAILENGPGPRLLIRTDLDALPVTEETGLPYASQTAGVMHACGHDIHITTMIGTARTLAALKNQ